MQLDNGPAFDAQSEEREDGSIFGKISRFVTSWKSSSGRSSSRDSNSRGNSGSVPAVGKKHPSSLITDRNGNTHWQNSTDDLTRTNLTPLNLSHSDLGTLAPSRFSLPQSPRTSNPFLSAPSVFKPAKPVQTEETRSQKRRRVGTDFELPHDYLGHPPRNADTPNKRLRLAQVGPAKQISTMTSTSPRSKKNESRKTPSPLCQQLFFDLSNKLINEHIPSGQQQKARQYLQENEGLEEYVYSVLCEKSRRHPVVYLQENVRVCDPYAPRIVEEVDTDMMSGEENPFKDKHEPSPLFNTATEVRPRETRTEQIIPRPQPIEEVTIPRSKPMEEVTVPRSKPIEEVTIPKPVEEVMKEKLATIDVATVAPSEDTASPGNFCVAQIKAIYARRNPKKLDSLDDGLLVKYKGREAQLLVKVCNQYNLDVRKNYTLASTWGEEKDMIESDGEAPTEAPTEAAPKSSVVVPVGSIFGTPTPSSSSSGSIFQQQGNANHQFQAPSIFAEPKKHSIFDSKDDSFQAPSIFAEPKKHSIFDAKDDGPGLFSIPSYTPPKETAQNSIFGSVLPPKTDVAASSVPRENAEGSIFGTRGVESSGSMFGTRGGEGSGSIFGTRGVESSGSIFGTRGVEDSGSMFGKVTEESERIGAVEGSGSIFRKQAPDAPSSIFGTAPEAPSSIFGTAPEATGSIFGTEAPKTPGSIFGTEAPKTPGSIFGTEAPKAPGSIFGTEAPSSIFGTPVDAPSSIFGTPVDAPSSIFGTAPDAPGSIFGTKAPDAQGSIFGTKATEATGSIFGTNAPEAPGSIFRAPPPPSSIFKTAADVPPPLFEPMEQPTSIFKSRETESADFATKPSSIFAPTTREEGFTTSFSRASPSRSPSRLSPSRASPSRASPTRKKNRYERTEVSETNNDRSNEVPASASTTKHMPTIFESQESLSTDAREQPSSPTIFPSTPVAETILSRSGVFSESTEMTSRKRIPTVQGRRETDDGGISGEYELMADKPVSAPTPVGQRVVRRVKRTIQPSPAVSESPFAGFVTEIAAVTEAVNDAANVFAGSSGPTTETPNPFAGFSSGKVDDKSPATETPNPFAGFTSGKVDETPNPFAGFSSTKVDETPNPFAGFSSTKVDETPNPFAGFSSIKADEKMENQPDERVKDDEKMEDPIEKEGSANPFSGLGLERDEKEVDNPFAGMGRKSANPYLPKNDESEKAPLSPSSMTDGHENSQSSSSASEDVYKVISSDEEADLPKKDSSIVENAAETSNSNLPSVAKSDSEPVSKAPFATFSGRMGGNLYLTAMMAAQEADEPSEPVIDPIIESAVAESTLTTDNGVLSAAPIPSELAVESSSSRQEEEVNTNLAMETEGLETSMVDKEAEGVDKKETPLDKKPEELETPVDKRPEELDTPLDKKPEELKPEMIHMMLDENVGSETTPMVDEEREGLEPEMVHMMYDNGESGNALDEDTMDENDTGNALDEDTMDESEDAWEEVDARSYFMEKEAQEPEIAEPEICSSFVFPDAPIGVSARGRYSALEPPSPVNSDVPVSPVETSNSPDISGVSNSALSLPSDSAVFDPEDCAQSEGTDMS